ncbi:MAG: hypothetical protein KDA75_10580 [Planctomycetaceae bacterium]|nr:hypothetical protein [Planctomycetaceae bacterium]
MDAPAPIPELAPVDTPFAEADCRRFVIAFVNRTLIALLALAAFNVTVDPYGAFGVHLVPAESRTGDSRTARAEMLRRFTGKTVLIGSSRTRVGYDGSLPGLPGGPALNVGLDGTHLHELALAVEQAARNPHIRRIVLSLDWHLLDAKWKPNSDFQCSRFNPDRNHFEHFCDLLWNGRSIEASIRALRRWKPSPTPQHDCYGFAVNAGLRFNRTPQSIRTRTTLAQYVGDEGYLQDLQPVESIPPLLDRMIRVCRDREIELTVVIDPVHCLLLEGLHVRNGWERYREWKSLLVQTASDAGVAVWDFTGYHPWTTEPLLDESSPAKSQWFWEPSHMRRELGDRILRRILGVDPHDETFGEQLTPDRLDNHFARIDRERLKWIATSPRESHSLAQLLRTRPDSAASPSPPATLATRENGSANR